MRIVFDRDGWEDYLYFQRGEAAVLRRLNALIAECMRDPFRGIGKPEPLKEEYQGWWSRRVNQEHRVIYRVTGKAPDQALEIIQCRYHY